ncbi:MAG: peptidylprolyl isomerase [Bryobacterales bacterium]|nr:peptidylprolyl isomerase [Bryobacterales bacterium]
MRISSFVFSGLALFAVAAIAQNAPPPADAPATAPAAEAAPDPAASVAPDAVVLSVGQQKFTREQFENLILALPPQLQAAARGPQKREFARQIAELFAVAGEAEKRQLDTRPELQMRLKYQRDNILAGFLYQQMVQEVTVDPAQVEKFYAENKDSFEEVTARHILVRFKGSQVPARGDAAELSEEEALTKAAALKARLDAGEKFEELAKAESDDVGSGQGGGSLGTFPKGQMIAEFENVAFTQPVGEVSEPVKTAFGYHLILVEDRKTKTIEEVRDEIAEQLKPTVAREQLKALTEAKGVTLSEDYLRLRSRKRCAAIGRALLVNNLLNARWSPIAAPPPFYWRWRRDKFLPLANSRQPAGSTKSFS